ncbi:Membrane protein involved in the export of O-antigen and teichoic acid [Lishizhenia tianjinensis]|uniref:Membrane protein involved in the export of O-antigen and teichoic acid n=1 Tax=Lishizhenia tianjinensis TaxID=477690 RepID=A0A1I7APB6_9FLAO|nr:oligosaccharide flippase family protein [Lishizhenia tianjinensis]SFT76788.1 Membrane protein involved in the export of O-antigen and teichoic acid [Lishizhenia tianjinensis]
MLKRINLKSELVKSVVLLTSGTVLAQVISLGLQPVIARLFTPDEMGELGYFLRWATFISSIATARYEMAIPLPKNKSHGFQLFRAALRISLYSMLAVLTCGLLYSLLGERDLEFQFFIIALAAASFGIIFRTLGTNWALTNKAFKRITASKITESLGMNGFRIFAGLLGFGVPGLIIATILGIFSSAIVFILDFFKIKGRDEFQNSKKKQFVLLKEYKDYPKVNLPHVILDTGRDLLLAILMKEYFDIFTYGNYDMSFRMLKIPLALVGGSIGQVFFQRCSESFANKQAIYPLLKKTTLVLTGLSILPFATVFFFGEEIFSFVLSERWSFSGEISEVLAPWLMVNFIISPVSTIPLVIKKQKIFFWLGLLGTILQLLVFGLLPYLEIFDDNKLNYFKVAGWGLALFLLFSLYVKLVLVKKADVINLKH